jgi:hypothetical protein
MYAARTVESVSAVQKTANTLGCVKTYPASATPNSGLTGTSTAFTCNQTVAWTISSVNVLVKNLPVFLTLFSTAETQPRATVGAAQ